MWGASERGSRWNPPRTAPGPCTEHLTWCISTPPLHLHTYTSSSWEQGSTCIFTRNDNKAKGCWCLLFVLKANQPAEGNSDVPVWPTHPTPLLPSHQAELRCLWRGTTEVCFPQVKEICPGCSSWAQRDFTIASLWHDSLLLARKLQPWLHKPFANTCLQVQRYTECNSMSAQQRETPLATATTVPDPLAVWHSHWDLHRGVCTAEAVSGWHLQRQNSLFTATRFLCLQHQVDEFNIQDYVSLNSYCHCT